MKRLFILFPLVAALLLSAGCDKQTKLTTEKIAEQTRKLTELQEIHAKQLAQLQEQLKALGPMLDKMSGAYFEKSYSDALFFHTNTLYMLLAVDRQIETELKAAEAARTAEHAQVYSYHTNQTDLMLGHANQIKELLAAEAERTRTNVNAENWRTAATFSKELAKQIQAVAPDADEIARRQQMAADLERIKADLALIKARLGVTNPAANAP